MCNPSTPNSLKMTAALRLAKVGRRQGKTIDLLGDRILCTCNVGNSVLSVAVEALRVSESMTITLENSAMASYPSRLGLVCPAMAFGQAAGYWSVTYCLFLLVWASPYCAASRTGILKSFHEGFDMILLPNPFFGELPLFVPLSRPLAARTQ
jgi:hypothetical protein